MGSKKIQFVFVVKMASQNFFKNEKTVQKEKAQGGHPSFLQ
jgi:hypothetical protein